MTKRKTYAAGYWGINASDGPKGYEAFGIPAPEDGTVCPTAVAASILAVPGEARKQLDRMDALLKRSHFSRYGYPDAFNLDAGWYDDDVIGIDLGMALLAYENNRTGIIWKLLGAHPAIKRGMSAARFHIDTSGNSAALYVKP